MAREKALMDVEELIEKVKKYGPGFNWLLCSLYIILSILKANEPKYAGLFHDLCENYGRYVKGELEEKIKQGKKPQLRLIQ